MRLADCQYTCRGCDRLVDAHEEPSPGEADMVCASCSATEDPEAVA